MTNRQIGDYGVETDFYVAYVPQAKELLNGNFIVDQYRGPVYQLFLAVTGFLFRYDYFFAGKFLNVISASIALYFISKIVGSIFSREGAFITVLLVAVNQVFLRYSYTPGTDMLFLALYTSSLYFILKNDELDYKNLLIAGILSGLAYLTRYTGISLIVFVVLVFFMHFYKKFKITHSFKKSFPAKSLTCYLVTVLVLSSIWGIISYQKTGHFINNMNFQNTALTVYKPDNMSMDEWTFKNQNTFKSMHDVVFKDFSTFVKRIFLNNFPLYFSKDMSRLLPKYLGILAAFGLIVFIIKFKFQNLSEKYFLLASLVFYFQILLIFYSERFSLPLLPFYCFLIVKLFSYDFLQRFNFNISKLRFFWIILFSLIVFNLGNSIITVRGDLNSGPKEILSIKDWIEKNYKEDLSEKTIMARKPHIAYYLDMKLEVTPYLENYNDFVQNIKNRNIDYVYVSEREADYLTNRNIKQVLLNYNAPPEELEVITKTTNPTAILYKVKK